MLNFHYTLYVLLVLFLLLLLGAGCKREKTKPTRQTKERVRRATIVFGGDVMQHSPQIEAARRDSTFDYDRTFQYVKPFFNSADFVILNFETTISTNQRYTGYPLFSSPAPLLRTLKNSGVDAVMLANNHICDKGARGIGATVKEVKEVGLRYSGAFADSLGYRYNNPMRFQIDSIDFALLNYTYGTNGMPIPKGTVVNLIDTVQIATDLKKVNRNRTDYTIIFFHWGIEYSKTPSTQQRELAEWCHKRGVDFVIGSHPHVIQPFERVTDSSTNTTAITLYSLGNIVSNQRWRRSDGGLLFRLEIEHRDGDKPKIDASYLLTWVDTPIVDGRREYLILPSFVADTMLKRGSVAQWSYQLFMDDSRKLLGGETIFREIKEAAEFETPEDDKQNPLPYLDWQPTH